MNKYSSFIILSFILTSCSNTKTEPVVVEKIPITIQQNKNLRFSAFVDSIQIIPLETTDDCLIGEINRIIYKENRYYLCATRGKQNGRLLVFDNEGKFIFKIYREGNGPGEWIDMTDFALNDHAEIKIMSFRKAVTFDTNGNFLRESKTTNHLTKEIISFADDKYLVYSLGASERGNKLLSIMNDEDQFVEDFFPVSSREVNKEITFNFNSLFSGKDTFFFNYPYNDTIYNIDRSLTITRAYYADYGRMKVPSNLFNPEDRAKAQGEKLDKLNDYGKVSAFGVMDDFIYIGSRDKAYNGYFSLYSKSSKQVVTGQRIVDDLYFIGNSIVLRAKHLPFNFDGNDILWQVDPVYILQGYQEYRKKATPDEWTAFCEKHSRLVDVCDKLKEDDNPVILRVTLKKF